MTTDSEFDSPGTVPLKPAIVAGWLGAWTAIGASLWLSFTWRRVAWITWGTRYQPRWEALSTDDFGLTVRELLQSLDLQLQVSGLLTAAVALILTDRMQKVGPRWLGWITGAGAVLALVSAILDPLKFA